MHLKFGNAASCAGPYPIAKGDGAEGVGRGDSLLSQPAVGQEALWLWEVAFIMGKSIVGHHEEGLCPMGNTESEEQT